MDKTLTPDQKQFYYDFYLLVAKMRVEQKKFFKTRYVHHLNESRKLEKQVDLYLKRLEEIELNTTLF